MADSYLGKPGEWNVTIPQGSDASATLLFQDSGGTPIALPSNTTYVFRVKPQKVSSTPVLEIILSAIDLPRGLIGIVFEAEDTAGLAPKGYYCDIRSYDTSSPPMVRTWSRGTFTVAPTTDMPTP